MSVPNWSDDRVEALAKLWADGLSASQIAAQLGGVTRNAVIGKVHRLGLSGRRAPSQPARAPRAPRVATPRRVAAKAAATKPAVNRPARPALRLAASAPLEPEARGQVDSMASLGAHACKWPIGDPKSEDFSFCGHATAETGPYCARHNALAYRPGKAAPVQRDPLVRRVLAGLAA